MSYNKEDIDKTFKEIVNEPDFMYDYAGTFLKDKPISYISIIIQIFNHIDCCPDCPWQL